MRQRLDNAVQQRGTAKQYKTFKDIIEPAMKRFKEIEDYEGTTREQMLYDRRFDDGDQWDQDDRDQRDREHRPCLTIPRTNQFSDKIKNEQAQNKPAVKAIPTDDGAQEKAAENREGLLKRIQYESRAQIARQHAFSCAVTEGRGHWRVLTQYATDASFDQDIMIDIIKEPLNVYLDWRHQMPDYSDAKYGFIIEKMSREEFKEQNPNSEANNWFSNYYDNDWITKDDIVIAEYFCEKEKERELIEYQDGGEVIKAYKDQIENADEMTDDVIIRSRKVPYKYWMWYKLTGTEVLDSKELPGIKSIPIMTTIGKETVINGKLNIKGIIRDLVDPQKMYNYWASQETEWVSMAPKAPFVGAEGQFEDHDDEFADANVITRGYLSYKPVSHDGHLVPPPQRQMPPTIPAGIVQAKQEIIEDMKAISGIYDASLGARSNETSGIAIKQREMQGDTASYHFVNNYKNALEHEGRVMNDMLTVYYNDTDRMIKIMGKDDEISTLKLGEDEKGEMVTLGDGEFDIRIELGPSYQTQRQEAAANMIDLAGKIAAIGQAAPDIAVKMLDMPMKDEMAERTKRLTEMQFPGITAPIEDQQNQEGQEMAMITQQLQQAQQQLEQMAQEREQMIQEMQKLDQVKVMNEQQKNELEKAKLELEAAKVKSDREIEEKKIEMDAMKADLDNETKLRIEAMKHEGDAAKMAMEAQYKRQELVLTSQEEPKEKEEGDKQSSVVNVSVDSDKLKEATITKQKDGSYHVVQKESTVKK